METVSGIGVVDKAFQIMNALAERAMTLGELVQVAQIPRATAHRLLVALEKHGAVQRGTDGRYVLGAALAGLGRRAAAQIPFLARVRVVAEQLRDATGESVQVYVSEAGGRRCVVSFESSHGLRWVVPEGSLLPLACGSAGHVLSGATLSSEGWIESVEEREKGVASVSAPITDESGQIRAALSLSGPLERVSAEPGRKFGARLVEAARSVHFSTR